MKFGERSAQRHQELLGKQFFNDLRREHVLLFLQLLLLFLCPSLLCNESEQLLADFKTLHLVFARLACKGALFFLGRGGYHLQDGRPLNTARPISCLSFLS